MQDNLEQTGQQGGAAEPVPNGLPQFGPNRMESPEAQGSIRELSDRIRQLEEQARQISAPFLMESALREAGELRLQAVKAAERTYNDAVQAAEQEAKRILDEAEVKAAELIDQAHAEGERRAEELLEQARREANGIRQGAVQAQTETRRELERLSAEFNAFVQRLLERSTPAHTTLEPIAQPAEPTPEPTVASAAVAAEGFGSFEGPDTFRDEDHEAAPPEPATVASTFAEASAPEPADFEPVAVAAAPDTDWGADWADQLHQVTPVELEPAAASEASAAKDKPEDPGEQDGFKLPSWLPRAMKDEG